MVVERAFVISLPFCEDRLTNFTRATGGFKSLPPIEVWPAVHGDTCQPPDSWSAGAGAWGCYKSHVNILEYCLNNGVGSYAVFEDDARFRPGFDDRLTKFMEYIPPEWQQAYLGGQLQHTHSHPSIKVNAEVCRPYNVNRTHGFMVSRAGMLPIYQHISNLPFMHEEHIDHHLGRWHEDMRSQVYTPHRWMVGQMGFSSNVSGKLEPPEFYTDPIDTALDHRLYNDPVCIVYRGTRSLLQKARRFLHPGNQIDANGFDVTLTLAARFADPVPEIDKWYGWIRGEIVRSNSSALPCLFHPRITTAMLDRCGFRYIEICPTTLDEIQEACANV